MLRNCLQKLLSICQNRGCAYVTKPFYLLYNIGYSILVHCFLDNLSRYLTMMYAFFYNTLTKDSIFSLTNLLVIQFR